MPYKGVHNLHRRVSGRPEAQIVTPIWIQSCNGAKSNVSYSYCFRCNVKKRYYELGVTYLTERSTLTMNGVYVYCLDRASGLWLYGSSMCQVFACTKEYSGFWPWTVCSGIGRIFWCNCAKGRNFPQNIHFLPFSPCLIATTVLYNVSVFVLIVQNTSGTCISTVVFVYVPIQFYCEISNT
jgi:hypothetical protein